MIFVTVGTEKFPFDRLLRALDEGLADGRIRGEVCVQAGCSTYASDRMQMVDRLPIERMAEKIRQAEAVVTHAGVGSVLLCYLLGVVPIVFPRRAELGEHVDDHQMEFARRMEREGELVAAYDGEDLLRAIAEYPDRLARTRRPAPGNGTRLTDYLEDWLSGAGSARD